MYKVLIVDDEPAILNGLKQIIKWEEHGVEIAAQTTSSIKALEILKNEKIDILLTDVEMPKLTGLELIRAINDNKINTKSIILSGYDDFRYVKEAVKLGIENYLLKPVAADELSATLLNTIEKIQSDLNEQTFQRESKNIFRENVLYRWVTNSINPSELEEKASVAGIKLEKSEYVAVIIKPLNNHAKTQDSEIDNDSLLSFGVINICNELAPKDLLAAAFYDLSGDVILLFNHIDISSRKAEIRSVLNSIMSSVTKFLKISIFVTIGSVQQGYKSVHSSYTEAVNLLEYSLIYPPDTIIDFEDMKESSINIQNNLNIDFKAFNELLNQGKEDECMEFIVGIFNDARKVKGVTPQFIQNIAVEILFNILSTIKILKGSHDDVNEFEGLFSDIFKITNIEKLIDLLELVVKKSVEYVLIEDKKLNPIIKQALNYIDKNYSKDISIKILASDLHVNAAYLGQLFKNEVGDMLTNYLNGIRIEKAKDLLLKSPFKANEISEMVGYANPNYFYRIFKKITGVSPTEFKGE